MAHVVDINNQTVQFIRIKYDLILNGIAYFEVVVDGADDTTRTNLAIDNQVDIYDSGTLKIQGKIYDQQVLEGGGVVVSGFGEEVEFTDYACPVDSGKNTKTYSATNDNTVFADLVSNATGWSSDVTGSTATTLQTFRVSESQTLWEGILSVIDVGNKDLEVDYSTTTLKLVDKKGTASAFRFSEGLNVAGVRRARSRVKASRVIVYGKGDGVFQVIGEAGSGTPVKKYYRPNIIDPDVADTLASTLLGRIQQDNLFYTFEVTNPTLDLSTGDQGKLDAATLGLEDISIDITKVIRRVTQNQLERLDVEVTNPELREARKTPQQNIRNMTRETEVRTSSMQGSGNTLTWGNAINAKSGAPMQIVFNIPADLVEDETGDIQISSMTLDYDVDPYKKGVGTASFNGGDPQVQGSSADEDAFIKTGTASGDTSADIDSGTASSDGGDGGKASDSASTSNSVTVSSTTTEYTIDTIDPGGASTQKMRVWVSGVYSGDSDISRFEFRIVRDGSAVDFSDPTYSHVLSNGSTRSIVYCAMEVLEDTSPYNYDINVEVDASSGLGSEEWIFWISYQTELQHYHGEGTYATENHDHDRGNYAADFHDHNDGSYDIRATDIDNISIGDDVSDAGSVNATGVDIYLDYWNTSTSSWDNKTSVTDTGTTLDTDVDITSSGTYPDAAGYWRVRIEPNNASADFVQGIIKIKHLLEN